CKTCSTCFCVGNDAPTGISSSTSPAASSVVVVLPSATSVLYSLGKVNKKGMILVASPTQIGKTPSTSGSSVPVCPTFFICNIFLILLTQSCDVSRLGF